MGVRNFNFAPKFSHNFAFLEENVDKKDNFQTGYNLGEGGTCLIAPVTTPLVDHLSVYLPKTGKIEQIHKIA